MTGQHESPLQSDAATRFSINDGDSHTYESAISALTPIRARLADWLSVAIGLAVAAWAARLAIQIGDAPFWQFGALAAMPVAALIASRAALYRLLKKSVRVVFTPDEFIIHGLVRTRRFDRNMPHKFALYPHDKAKREAEVIEFRTGKMRRSLRLYPPKRYLGSSYHLSFEYLDQRNDILTIYRLKDAHRILARLKACDAIMDGHARKGGGQALTPEQDWSLQPGGLQTDNY